MIARPFGRHVPDGDDHSGIAAKLLANAQVLQVSLVRASGDYKQSVYYELHGSFDEHDEPLKALQAMLDAFNSLPPIECDGGEGGGE